MKPWTWGPAMSSSSGESRHCTPDLATLILHALGRELAVEVYSNLVRVTDSLWTAFERPGVRLATSYYSPDAAQHNAITDRRSHDRTLANIRKALRRGIPLRVGLVDVDEGQDIAGALAELESLGVTAVGVEPAAPGGSRCSRSDAQRRTALREVR